MSKKYQGEKPDSNQQEIADKLRGIPGMEVHLGFKDKIIGYEMVTIWGECKNPNQLKKDGTFKKHSFTKFEKNLNETFTGCRIVYTSFNECIEKIAEHFSMLGFIRIAENLLKFKEK